MMHVIHIHSLYPFFIYVAPTQTCAAANINVQNSVTLSPTAAGVTCTPYSVTCRPGYTASSSSGFMDCAWDGSWLNKPQCAGK